MSKKKIIYSFLGLPASGKGTQAKALSATQDIEMVSAGDLIRHIMTEGNDPFVSEIKKHYDAGIPQPDEVVIDLFRQFLDKAEKSVILDNFPFSIGQADFLNEYIKTHQDWSGPVIIYIHLDAEEAIRRAITRKICSSCAMIYGATDEMICEKCGGSLMVRTDDNEETMRTRINQYLPRLNSLIDYFKKLNSSLLEIDGTKNIPDVTNEINTRIDEFTKF